MKKDFWKGCEYIEEGACEYSIDSQLSCEIIYILISFDRPVVRNYFRRKDGFIYGVITVYFECEEDDWYTLEDGFIQTSDESNAGL